jgi:hypothetical protein
MLSVKVRIKIEQKLKEEIRVLKKLFQIEF